MFNISIYALRNGANRKQAKPPENVEDLQHFPFKSFGEFKKAVAEGDLNIGVDRSVALRWGRGGIYCPKLLRYYGLFLSPLPFLAAIGFVVYSVLSLNWLLLLALPVLFIAFFVFHPSSAMIFGPIRSGFLALTFIGFVYSLSTGRGWLFALTMALITIWWALGTIYSKAVRHLTLAATIHEDLLCLLWHMGALNIRLNNGNSYWVDWKTEDGRNVFYGEDE